MEERPGSWHHAMRVSVLSRVNGMKNWQRCAWFASSAALVAVQLIAVLTFIAGLSWKKCMHVDGMEERDCLPGFYCGGVRFLDPDVDVFDERKQLVLRGTCYECSSAVLGGQLLGLLDAMCPGGSIPGVGIDPSLDDDCIKKCYLAQVGPCANMTSRAQPYHGIPSHTMDYSLSDRSCAAFCTARCVAAMPTEAKDWFERANAEIAIENNPGFNRFLTWMSIRDQCGQCEPSRRLSKLYMTVSEAEVNKVLMMSSLDHISLVLASLIIALIAYREVRDMLLGDMYMRQAHVERRGSLIVYSLADDFSLRRLLWGCRRGGVGEGERRLIAFKLFQRYMIGVISGLRRYLLIPNVLTTVVLLVLRLGGDTVNVLLNTMATAFMLELDNLAYEYGISHRTRVHIEEKWRVVMSTSQTRLMDVIRRWHVVTITLAIPVLVIASTMFVESSVERHHTASRVFLIIMAFGEILELGMLHSSRARDEQAQRLVCFVLKVASFVLFNEFAMPPLVRSVPNLHAPWDPASLWVPHPKLTQQTLGMDNRTRLTLV